MNDKMNFSNFNWTREPKSFLITADKYELSI